MSGSAIDELTGATGLALAVIVSLIEGEAPIPKGEVGRYLAKMAEAADPAAPKQRQILEAWAQLLGRDGAAH